MDEEVEGSTMIKREELEIILKMLDEDQFDSILIDKRDPITYRLFKEFPDGKRICLHKIGQGKTAIHAHKYNVRVLILQGEYTHNIGYWNGTDSDFSINHVYTSQCGAGHSYEIDDPNTLHGLVARGKPVYSIMINDYNFGSPNPKCISTKGNDLGPIPTSQKQELVNYFKDLISWHLCSIDSVD